MDSETFRGRNQSIGCALALVSKARNSESYGAIPQDLRRLVIFSLSIGGDVLWHITETDLDTDLSADMKMRLLYTKVRACGLA